MSTNYQLRYEHKFVTIRLKVRTSWIQDKVRELLNLVQQLRSNWILIVSSSRTQRYVFERIPVIAVPIVHGNMSNTFSGSKMSEGEATEYEAQWTSTDTVNITICGDEVSDVHEQVHRSYFATEAQNGFNLFRIPHVYINQLPHSITKYRRMKSMANDCQSTLLKLLDIIVKRVASVLFPTDARGLYSYYCAMKISEGKLARKMVNLLRKLRNGSVEKRVVRVCLFSSIRGRVLYDLMNKYGTVFESEIRDLLEKNGEISDSDDEPLRLSHVLGPLLLQKEEGPTRETNEGGETGNADEVMRNIHGTTGSGDRTEGLGGDFTSGQNSSSPASTTPASIHSECLANFAEIAVRKVPKVTENNSERLDYIVYIWWIEHGNQTTFPYQRRSSGSHVVVLVQSRQSAVVVMGD